jgi:hypothetical protein
MPLDYLILIAITSVMVEIFGHRDHCGDDVRHCDVSSLIFLRFADGASSEESSHFHFPFVAHCTSRCDGSKLRVSLRSVTMKGQ